MAVEPAKNAQVRSWGDFLSGEKREEGIFRPFPEPLSHEPPSHEPHFGLPVVLELLVMV